MGNEEMSSSADLSAGTCRKRMNCDRKGHSLDSGLFETVSREKLFMAELKLVSLDRLAAGGGGMI